MICKTNQRWGEDKSMIIEVWTLVTLTPTISYYVFSLKKCQPMKFVVIFKRLLSELKGESSWAHMYAQALPSSRINNDCNYSVQQSKNFK